jgi:hypothetical protein
MLIVMEQRKVKKSQEDFTTNLHPQANATRCIAGRLIHTNPDNNFEQKLAKIAKKK